MAMADAVISFKDGKLCRLFTLHADADNMYEVLVAKLAQFGFKADRQNLLYLCNGGWRNVIHNSETFWECYMDEKLDDRRGLLIESDKSEYYDEDVYFWFKNGSLGRRFSLKLATKQGAYQVLLQKLHNYGYKLNGRVLCSIDDDGKPTVIKDDDSLWNAIYDSIIIGAVLSLTLEYRQANEAAQNPSESTHCDPETVPSRTEILPSDAVRCVSESSDTDSFTIISSPSTGFDNTDC
ncbi:hypothetical protein Tcan_14814 [Toxocara canis]|uniref:Uncharacterized protein n=1 Tax=Toxocara canis TaxID=6265 RepID=A0A0B2VZU8_TOXCA|nr:hypothetical protein Tcan_14814 [Toxocara canis]